MILASPARPGYRAMLLLLAALSMIGPFTIDTYLPSFPDIAAELGATPVEVQQTLTFYLGPFAIMMLWHGALSDALGRRPVILAGLTVYTLASLGCAFVSSIEQLWALRALQGISAGVGLTVGRAIIRDLHDGADARRLMGHVGMVFALAPAIAPVIGGTLHAAAGWRSVFLLLFGLGCLLLLSCWRWLPETLAADHRQSLKAGELLRAYRAVLSDPPFLTASAAIAFAFAGVFIYILSAPVVVIQHLGLGPEQFGYLFIPATAGMMAGSALAARWADNDPARSIRKGFLLMALAATLNLTLRLLDAPPLPWAIVPLPLYTIGMSVVMPGLTLLALDRFPDRRGLAASCQGFIHTSGNTLAAGLLVPLLWSSLVTMAAGMVALLLGAFLFALGYRAVMRRRAMLR